MEELKRRKKLIYPADFKLKSSRLHKKGAQKPDEIEEEKVVGNKREAEKLKTATV